MSQIIEHFRRVHAPTESFAETCSRLEGVASELRPHWWNNTHVSPWFDVGLFRLTDPRRITSNIECVETGYEDTIAHLRAAGKDPTPQILERDTLRAYARKRKAHPYTRMLDLHIPPRPPEAVRQLPQDLPNSAAQLAGWIEAFNCYHPDTPIGFITGRTSLAGSKRAPTLGFDLIRPDTTEWSLTGRLDIIEHLVQNPTLKAENLLKSPLWTLLTGRREFSRTHGVKRYNHTKFTLQTTQEHTIELPNEGNGWQLWLRATHNSDRISNHDAQVLRGAIQVATAVAHDAGRDIRIRIPNTQAFSPFFDRIQRHNGPWTLYRASGTPVTSYGYPSMEFLSTFVT